MKAAIFDVDNTITTRDTFFLFFRFLFARKPLRVIRAYRLPYSFLLTRVFRRDRILVKEDVMRLLEGLADNEIKNLCEIFVNQLVVKTISAGARQAIAEHQKNGYKIILISASPEIYLMPLSKILKVDYFLGTKSKINDKHTVTLGAHCYGPEKCQRLQQLLLAVKCFLLEPFYFLVRLSISVW